MTEAEWLACANPHKMLRHLKGKASDRKIRLLACACCRRVSSVAGISELVGFIEVAEDYADGQASVTQLESASRGADAMWDYCNGLERASPRDTVLQAIAQAVTLAMNCVSAKRVEAMFYAARALAWKRDGSEFLFKEAFDKEQANQCTLVRDIFGNPFRPVLVDPGWLTSSVTSLAQSAYDKRAFDRMPILADALEEAGCTNADILGHCLGPGPYVRGCWVVDLLLDKS